MSGMKKAVIIVIIIVVVVAVACAAFWYGYSVRSAPPGGSAASLGANSSASSTPTSSTRGAVPANVVVPDKGASSTPVDVAVPVIQGAGDPSGNVSYRSFNISVQNGAYDPSTVIVKEGDTVDIEITAVDAAYGFTQPDYGWNVVIPKGKTQAIQFQASQSGDFTFYCASCGGPSSGPVGHLIVAAK